MIGRKLDDCGLGRIALNSEEQCEFWRSGKMLPLYTWLITGSEKADAGLYIRIFSVGVENSSEQSSKCSSARQGCKFPCDAPHGCTEVPTQNYVMQGTCRVQLLYSMVRGEQGTGKVEILVVSSSTNTTAHNFGTLEAPP